MHTLPHGLGMALFKQLRHFTESFLNTSLQVTLYKNIVQHAGRGLYAHYTCSCARVQHAYNGIRLHNKVIEHYNGKYTTFPINLCDSLFGHFFLFVNVVLVQSVI